MEAAAAIYHAPDREKTILAKVSLSEVRKGRLAEGTAGRRLEMLPGRDSATHPELHSHTMTIFGTDCFVLAIIKLFRSQIHICRNNTHQEFHIYYGYTRGLQDSSKQKSPSVLYRMSSVGLYLRLCTSVTIRTHVKFITYK